MGMFDELTIEYPFPDPEFQGDTFQTKDLECMMDRYTITADGSLVHHQTHYEDVPEEERPNYGKPEWEKGAFYRAMGMLKVVPDGDVVLSDMHGDIYISASRDANKDWRYYQWRVRFTHGKVESITLVDSPELEAEWRKQQGAAADTGTDGGEGR